MCWFHDDVMLRDGVDGISINMGDSVSSIVIGEVECTTGGTYICRANNTVGTDQESYSLTILSKSHRFLFNFPMSENYQYTILSYNDYDDVGIS